MERIVGGTERLIVKFMCYGSGLFLVLSTSTAVFVYWLFSIVPDSDYSDKVTTIILLSLLLVSLLLTIRILITGYRWLEDSRSIRLSKYMLFLSLTLGITGLITSLYTVLVTPSLNRQFQAEEFNIVGVNHDINNGFLNVTVLYTNYSGAPMILVRDRVKLSGRVTEYYKNDITYKYSQEINM